MASLPPMGKADFEAWLAWPEDSHWAMFVCGEEGTFTVP
jgi:hypothetical protein